MPFSVANQNISALFEDDRHILWIGTDEGVFQYDPAADVFTFLDAQTDKGETITTWISTILKDEKGNIWICAPSQGVFRYDERNFTAIPISLTDLIPITSVSATMGTFMPCHGIPDFLSMTPHNQHFVQIKEDARDARC